MNRAKTIHNNKSALSYKDGLMRVHRFYGVEIWYSAPNENKIQYILECDYLGYIGTVYRYRISRKKVYVNSKPLSGKIDELIEKCMASIYPLILNVNFSGDIEGVENLDEIRDKWSKIRHRLEIEYAGKVAEDYLDLTEKAFSSDELFLQKIGNDIIFNLLIPKRINKDATWLHKDNDAVLHIPHPNASGMLRFRGNHELNPYPDSNGLIKYSFDGRLDDEGPTGSQTVKEGKLTLDHFLDSADSSMVHTVGHCELLGNQHYAIDYKVTRLKELELTNKP